MNDFEDRLRAALKTATAQDETPSYAWAENRRRLTRQPHSRTAMIGVAAAVVVVAVGVAAVVYRTPTPEAAGPVAPETTVSSVDAESFSAEASTTTAPSGTEVLTTTALIFVPDWSVYYGLPYTEVETELTDLGFDVEVVNVASFQPSDTVTGIDTGEMDPQSTFTEGTSITVQVSDFSQFLMPSVTGLTLEDATQLIIQSGWLGGVSIVPTDVPTTDPAEIGVVTVQAPEAGAPYPKVGVINLSRGVAKQIEVPAISGQTLEDAMTALRANGWTGRFKVTTSATADPDLVGKILTSAPEGGSLIDFNQNIDVQVGITS